MDGRGLDWPFKFDQTNSWQPAYYSAPPPVFQTDGFHHFHHQPHVAPVGGEPFSLTSIYEDLDRALDTSSPIDSPDISMTPPLSPTPHPTGHYAEQWKVTQPSFGFANVPHLNARGRPASLDANSASPRSAKVFRRREMLDQNARKRSKSASSFWDKHSSKDADYTPPPKWEPIANLAMELPVPQTLPTGSVSSSNFFEMANHPEGIQRRCYRGERRYLQPNPVTVRCKQSHAHLIKNGVVAIDICDELGRNVVGLKDSMLYCPNGNEERFTGSPLEASFAIKVLENTKQARVRLVFRIAYQMNDDSEYWEVLYSSPFMVSHKTSSVSIDENLRSISQAPVLVYPSTEATPMAKEEEDCKWES
ncbi:hypothetical protein PROFUN_03410 [Planoprotostelium fungivorum]|uniref:Uncharacterized protein n=1 Tax=Planoprotostelium fungivorum TaxID=1890364 RepID=A0A2P6NWG5_9EUKA|nr:hypothetical protein PROFUN_03410 [Planoprotostelium fungivorum]